MCITYVCTLKILTLTWYYATRLCHRDDPMLPCFLFPSFPSLLMAPFSFTSFFFTHWQVKLPTLHDYLLSMRRRGYALVGAEQTANSRDIVNFNFRPNTVLVLGYASLYFFYSLKLLCLIFRQLLEAIVCKMLGCGILRTTYNNMFCSPA